MKIDGFSYLFLWIFVKRILSFIQNITSISICFCWAHGSSHAFHTFTDRMTEIVNWLTHTHTHTQTECIHWRDNSIQLWSSVSVSEPLLSMNNQEFSSYTKHTHTLESFSFLIIDLIFTLNVFYSSYKWALGFLFFFFWLWQILSVNNNNNNEIGKYPILKRNKFILFAVNFCVCLSVYGSIVINDWQSSYEMNMFYHTHTHKYFHSIWMTIQVGRLLEYTIWTI